MRPTVRTAVRSWTSRPLAAVAMCLALWLAAGAFLSAAGGAEKSTPPGKAPSQGKAPAQQNPTDNGKPGAEGKSDEAPWTPAKLQVLQTAYYTIHSDLQGEALQEAALRMTRMAEEYHNRTQSFSGAIRQRLPFYLFQHREDYLANGGMAGTVGVFMVKGNEQRLMALAGEKASFETWHTIQHEGFHQFAYNVIGELPPWADEGLAEYFGEGLWTGDGYVTGLMSPGRSKGIRQAIKMKAFQPLETMLAMSHKEWNTQMSGENYDQAWAMCQFLAHAQDGKYQSAFSNFIRNVNRKMKPETAWQQSFGSVAGFQETWEKWWSETSASPTADLYTRVALNTLGSYLARAYFAKKSFGSIDELVADIKAGSTTFTGQAWLPPSLFVTAVKLQERDPGKFFVTPAGKGKLPTIGVVSPSHVRTTLTFPGREAYPIRFTAVVDDLERSMDQAKALVDAGKTAEAKALLTAAIRRNPTSSSMEAARQMAASLK